MKGKGRMYQERDIVKDYEVIQYIGGGQFGQVFEVAKGKDTFAMKVIPQEKFDEIEKLRQLYDVEKTILQKLDCKYVLQAYEEFQLGDQEHLITEMCAHGDLDQKLNQSKDKRLPEKQAYEIIKQCLLGLTQLHKMKIIHRDLKPDNIFIHNNVYKLADLGFAKELQDDQLAETSLGTPHYMAPEVMKFDKYNFNADVYSLGVILFQMVIGKYPFNGSDENQLLKAKREQKLDFSVVVVSDEFKDICAQMLQFDPNERISMEGILKHAFYQKYDQVDRLLETILPYDVAESPKVHKRGSVEEESAFDFKDLQFDQIDQQDAIEPSCVTLGSEERQMKDLKLSDDEESQVFEEKQVRTKSQILKPYQIQKRADDQVHLLLNEFIHQHNLIKLITKILLLSMSNTHNIKREQICFLICKKIVLSLKSLVKQLEEIKERKDIEQIIRKDVIESQELTEYYASVKSNLETLQLYFQEIQFGNLMDEIKNLGQGFQEEYENDEKLTSLFPQLARDAGENFFIQLVRVNQSEDFSKIKTITEQSLIMGNTKSQDLLLLQNYILDFLDLKSFQDGFNYDQYYQDIEHQPVDQLSQNVFEKSKQILGKEYLQKI